MCRIGDVSFPLGCGEYSVSEYVRAECLEQCLAPSSNDSHFSKCKAELRGVTVYVTVLLLLEILESVISLSLPSRLEVKEGQRTVFEEFYKFFHYVLLDLKEYLFSLNLTPMSFLLVFIR